MKPRLSMAQLEKLRSVMQRMLSEAENANWSELSRLDSERRVILNYPEQGSSDQASHEAVPAISSGSRPLRLAAESVQMSSSTAVRHHANAVPPSAGPGQAVDEHYRALCNDVMALDKAIKQRIEQAKESLLRESRDVKAQIKARNGYEKTRNMTFHTYS